MAEKKLEYRIWQRGGEWHWQVMFGRQQIAASGTAHTSSAARVAALDYCLHHQKKPET